MTRKRLSLGIVALALMLVATVTAFTWPEVASWFNQVLSPQPSDLDLTGVEVVGGSFEKTWVAELRWGENGLRRPGLLDDNPVLVGPGDQIAVGDGALTRLFAATGEFLGVRSGAPAGFLGDGSLVTVGPLRLYDSQGTLVWESDPWEQVLIEKGLQAKAAEDLVRGNLSVYTSASQVYCSMHVEVGEVVTQLSPEYPGQVQQAWKTVDEFDVGVSLDGSGNTDVFEEGTFPGRLIFTPWGTAFGAGVETSNGKAYREFDMTSRPFILKRTLHLDAASILAASKDGSLIGQDAPHPDGSRNWFTVYRPGTSRAIRAKMPDDEWLLHQYSEGCLYTHRETEEALVITCWVWPTP